MPETSPKLFPAPYGLGVVDSPTSGQKKARAAAGAKVCSLFRALMGQDQTTAEHSLRVRMYALLVAEEFGLAAESHRQLGLAALLHDLGKICLPSDVLNKPDKLTPEEIRLVQMHPVISELMMRSLLPHSEALAIVRWHHERPDGLGYPDGLTGASIPLAARILAVADSFDAMTSSRPYRPAIPWHQALDTLLLWAGVQFDYEVVECFTRIVRQTWGGRQPYSGQSREGFVANSAGKLFVSAATARR